LWAQVSGGGERGEKGLGGGQKRIWLDGNRLGPIKAVELKASKKGGYELGCEGGKGGKKDTGALYLVNAIQVRAWGEEMVFETQNINKNVGLRINENYREKIGGLTRQYGGKIKKKNNYLQQ